MPMKSLHAAGNRCDIRVLSYNIQVGLPAERFRHYLTGAWRHVLPSSVTETNLRRIAEVIAGYDIVLLQEADAGSLRTRFLNQVQFLAAAAGYAHWGTQVTRDLSPVARHCLGYLSRYAPESVEFQKLPGPLPGRGAIYINFDIHGRPLKVVNTHLSLGRKAQHRQLDYICSDLGSRQAVILAGDLNCEPANLATNEGLKKAEMGLYTNLLPTYPSWRPARCIDHILTNAEARIVALETVPAVLSDHLPVSASVELAGL